jgi:hypothetical protein
MLSHEQMFIVLWRQINFDRDQNQQRSTKQLAAVCLASAGPSDGSLTAATFVNYNCTKIWVLCVPLIMFPRSTPEPAHNNIHSFETQALGLPSGLIPSDLPTKTLCMSSGSQGRKHDVGGTAYTRKSCLVRMSTYSSLIHEAVFSSETSV